MRLATFDMIQLRGLHPYNPVTGERVEDLLQYFAVTMPVEGDTIPPAALLPIPGVGYPHNGAPILMADVVSHNLVRVAADKSVNCGSHSPAPWTYQPGSDRSISDATDKTLFCDISYYPWCSENEADWPLIAAAPEYHEAALALVARHDAIARRCNFTTCGCDDCVPFRAVISKAEGRG